MTGHWLRGLKTMTQAHSRGSRGPCRGKPLSLEALEGRQLLSGATVYTVNSTSIDNSGTGNSGTLPYVIGHANIDPNPAGSDIEFDPTVFAASSPQTITLSGTLELSESAGPEVIDGPGATALTVSGGTAVEVFLVDSGVTATLSGLTISNGWATFGSGPGNGGGICNDGGTLTVDDCVITDNFAQGSGGGIFSSGGQLNISGGSVISNNRATDAGGGVWSNGILNMTGSALDNNSEHSGEGGGLCIGGGSASASNCTFSGNVAESGESRSSGGGIYVGRGSLTLTASELVNNSAGDVSDDGFEGGESSSSSDGSSGHNRSGSESSGANRSDGGGLYNSCGHVRISNCDLSGNIAQGAGGGIFNARGTLEVDGSTLSGNSAMHSGGGMYVAGGTVTIAGSTIGDNSAVVNGGGIANEGALTIVNSTSTTNTAAFGGGIWTDGSLLAVNVTIARNQTVGESVARARGSMPSRSMMRTGAPLRAHEHRTFRLGRHAQPLPLMPRTLHFTTRSSLSTRARIRIRSLPMISPVMSPDRTT